MRRYSSLPLVGALGCLAAGLAGCDTNPLAPAREHPAALFSRGGSKSPSNTSARPENSSGVEITWTDNSSSEDGFHVERSTNGGVSWTTVYRTDPNQTRTFDSGRSAESPELCYRVSAFNRNGDSAPSNTDCTTPPAGPTNLAASAQDDQTIALAWADNSAVEDGYEVQRATSYTGPYTVIAKLPANATSYRDESVTPDVTYWYYVRATKDGGFSNQSNYASAVVAATPPNTPSGTDAAASNSTTIDVSWSDNSGNEDGFRIERSTDEGASWVSAGTTAKNERSFADSGRTVEQRTCYRVVAFNGKGDSAPSSTDCTSTTPGPTDLIATLVGPLTIDLVWTDNSGSEDGYVVERIYFPQEDWFVVAELPPNSTSHRDTVPFSWTQYTYRVRAKKDGGFSDFSNEAWAETPP